ncbi:hypothetical protein, partial [Endozoicomonas sp.]|uniref:hypothetical protein n=1 Tax=Endozoicomonas sp. TaxID=1892382 RepID=UPI00383B40CB
NHRNRVCGWVLALPRRAWERGGFCDNRLREGDSRGGVLPFCDTLEGGNPSREWESISSSGSPPARG